MRVAEISQVFCPHGAGEEVTELRTRAHQRLSPQRADMMMMSH